MNKDKVEDEEPPQKAIKNGSIVTMDRRMAKMVRSMCLAAYLEDSDGDEDDFDAFYGKISDSEDDDQEEEVAEDVNKAQQSPPGQSDELKDKMSSAPMESAHAKLSDDAGDYEKLPKMLDEKVTLDLTSNQQK